MTAVSESRVCVISRGRQCVDLYKTGPPRLVVIVAGGVDNAQLLLVFQPIAVIADLDHVSMV